MRAVSTCSTNIWMSSHAGSNASAPLSRSSRMPCSASMMASASACGRMCCAPSIAACAMLPVMSSRYIRLSKRMEELKSSATGSVTPAVRPAHIFAMVMVSLRQLSPQRTASLGSLWKSCGSLQRTRHARTFASRAVFSPPYTPPEKMIGISLRLRAQTLRGFWNDLPAPGGPARGENHFYISIVPLTCSCRQPLPAR